MANDLISLLLWASATLSVGILIVLALRVPVRRFAGARVAYLLWLIPPLGFLAWLAPARQVMMALPQAMTGTDVGIAEAAPGSTALLLACLWLAGLIAKIAVFRLQQRKFEQSAGRLEPVATLGRNVFAAAPAHGPAVVGALRPIIVLPYDFRSRFSPGEQALILAHERAHVERGDPLVNAAAMAVRAVHWFNPLVHVAARALRTDQELACDATVIARHTGSQRTYAEAMLKSHAAAFDVPLGCAWHTAAFHPLKERILMLTTSPSRLSRNLGLSFVAVAALSVGGAVWLMRPVVVLAAPSAAQEPAPSESDVDAEWQADMEAQAEADAHQAKKDARAAMEDARRAAREAAVEARAAIVEARQIAAVEARKAARQAIIDAQAALADAQPAIAAAHQALKEAEPVIASARAEAKAAAKQALREVRAALTEAQRTQQHALKGATQQQSACKRALARSRPWDDLLKSLETLVCIAPPFDDPEVAPVPQDR